MSGCQSSTLTGKDACGNTAGIKVIAARDVTEAELLTSGTFVKED